MRGCKFFEHQLPIILDYEEDINMSTPVKKAIVKSTFEAMQTKSDKNPVKSRKTRSFKE